MATSKNNKGNTIIIFKDNKPYKYRACMSAFRLADWFVKNIGVWSAMNVYSRYTKKFIKQIKYGEYLPNKPLE